MTTPTVHKIGFQLPVLSKDHGRGQITHPQSYENVTWRCSIVGCEDGRLGLQLICNQEDKSNFWSIEADFVFSIVMNGKEMPKQSGRFVFRTRRYLMLRMTMAAVEKYATKSDGLLVQFTLTIHDKEGIRVRRNHDFTVQEKNLHNLTMIVEGKKIFCSKQIVALNSEFFMDLLFPDGNKELQEIKLPSDFKYDKILRLIKVFYNDSDALNAANVDETLELATNLKSDNARQRCEKWVSRTQTMSPAKKMSLAEKYGLVELQNECVSLQKTTQQLQRLFEKPHEFTSEQMNELASKMQVSLVGYSYDNFCTV